MLKYTNILCHVLWRRDTETLLREENEAHRVVTQRGKGARRVIPAIDTNCLNASSISNTQRESHAWPTSPLPIAILNVDRLRGVSLSIVNDLHRTVQRYNYIIAER